MSPDGIWPWAENNQGLLSIAALIIALSIAVYEIKRAARSETRALSEYIDWVLSCADRSIELTNDALRTIDGEVEGTDEMSIAMWRFLNSNAIATLEEIQPLRPSQPKLAHHVARLLRCMSFGVESSANIDVTREQLDMLKCAVEIERAHIARILPNSCSYRLVLPAIFTRKTIDN